MATTPTKFQSNISDRSAADNSAELKAISAREAARGAAIGGVIQGAETAYKTKLFMDSQDMKKQAGDLRNEFLTREQARMSLQKVTAARDALTGSVSSSEDQPEWDQPLTPQQTKQNEAQMATIGILNNDIQRLKEASQGGMSNEQYFTRVSALTSKYIAQYPGLADEIRKKIGEVTGLPGADEWASRQFVEDRFAKPKPDQEGEDVKALRADLAMLSKYGMGSQEENLAMRQAGDPEYKRRITLAQSMAKTEAQAAAIKAGLQSREDVSDDEAKQETKFFTAFGAASIGKSFEAMGKDKNNLLEQISKETDPVKIDVLTQTWAAQVKQIVSDSTDESLRLAYQYFDKNPRVSKAVRDDIIAQIKAQGDMFRNKFQFKDSMVLISKINRDYRDKSLEERFKLFQLATAQQAAFANSRFAGLYWEGGKAREQVKQELPAFYNMMDRIEKILTGTGQDIEATIGATAQMNDVARVVSNAARTGDVPTEKLPAEVLKPAAELSVRDGIHAQSKIAKGEESVSQEDLGRATGLYNWSIRTGAGGIEHMFGKVSKDFKALDEKTKAEVAAKAGQADIEVRTAIQKEVEAINKQQGTQVEWKLGYGGYEIDMVDKNGQRDMKPYIAHRKTQLKNMVLSRVIIKGIPMAQAAKEIVDEFNSGVLSNFAGPPPAAQDMTDEEKTVVEYAKKTGLDPDYVLNAFRSAPADDPKKKKLQAAIAAQGGKNENQ